MNKNMIKMLLPFRNQFVPLLYTPKQWSVMEKYSHDKTLTPAERKALYTSIKKKTDALATFATDQQGKEYYITGEEHIIPERFAEAKRIIDEERTRHQHIFIGGSFLSSKQYNDIDIFVLRERGYKEEHEGNKHVVYLTEKKLSLPLFQSTALISIGTFPTHKKITRKKSTLNTLMSTYHEAVIEYLQKDKKPEAIRRLLFEHALSTNDRLLDPKELQQLIQHATISTLTTTFQELCKTLYSKTYLYLKLHEYIKTLKETIQTVQPNKHLHYYKKTYEELIHER